MPNRPNNFSIEIRIVPLDGEFSPCKNRTMVGRKILIDDFTFWVITQQRDQGDLAKVLAEQHRHELYACLKLFLDQKENEE